jgi:hypothetical protein
MTESEKCVVSIMSATGPMRFHVWIVPIREVATMTCSAARLAANQANAQKSTGPKTDAGKSAARANAMGCQRGQNYFSA